MSALNKKSFQTRTQGLTKLEFLSRISYRSLCTFLELLKCWRREGIQPLSNPPAPPSPQPLQPLPPLQPPPTPPAPPLQPLQPFQPFQPFQPLQPLQPAPPAPQLYSSPVKKHFMEMSLDGGWNLRIQRQHWLRKHWLRT